MDRLGQPGCCGAQRPRSTPSGWRRSWSRRAEDARPLVLAAVRVLAGASLPQLPAAMRSLWAMLVPDEERRRTAYALVSIVFEVSVISAPAIAGAIIALVSPAAAVIVAAGA